MKFATGYTLMTVNLRQDWERIKRPHAAWWPIFAVQKLNKRSMDWSKLEPTELKFGLELLTQKLPGRQILDNYTRNFLIYLFAPVTGANHIPQ